MQWRFLLQTRKPAAGCREVPGGENWVLLGGRRGRLQPGGPGVRHTQPFPSLTKGGGAVKGFPPRVAGCRAAADGVGVCSPDVVVVPLPQVLNFLRPAPRTTSTSSRPSSGWWTSSARRCRNRWTRPTRRSPAPSRDPSSRTSRPPRTRTVPARASLPTPDPPYPPKKSVSAPLPAPPPPHPEPLFLGVPGGLLLLIPPKGLRPL